MASIIVEGVEYPVPEEFSYRELQVITRMSGLALDALEDAFKHGNPGVVVAVAVIVKRRAGETVDEDAMFDLPADAITTAADVLQPEADPRPPADGGAPESPPSSPDEKPPDAATREDAGT